MPRRGDRHPPSCRARVIVVVGFAFMSDNAAYPRQGSGADPDMPTDERTATRVRLLHAIFEYQTRVTPAVLALDVPPARPGMPRVRLTYAELDAAADSLAARLAPHVHGECVVAVLLPRSGSGLFTAQLAIMKAGAAWTCIEPGTAPERLRFLLEDSRAVAVVAGEAERAELLAVGFPGER